MRARREGEEDPMKQTGKKHSVSGEKTQTVWCPESQANKVLQERGVSESEVVWYV